MIIHLVGVGIAVSSINGVEQDVKDGTQNWIALGEVSRREFNGHATASLTSLLKRYMLWIDQSHPIL